MKAAAIIMPGYKNGTSMEKAYIILAHRSPLQLYRLLRNLDDNQSTFFVHIDKKVALDDFSGLIQFGDKVILVKRVVSNWAEFGLVEATINALQAVKDSGKPVERIILLSGQDYPVKSNDFINRFLASSPHSIFLESVMIPDYNRWKPGGGIYRVNKYFFGFRPYQKYAAKALNLCGRIIPFLKRRPPSDILHHFGGAQWWIIDMFALNYILEFLKTNKAYYRFHKSSFAPDELFFHTILLNAKNEKLAASIANAHMRFINWEDTSLGHPEILQKHDFPKILQSDALFARKFDEDVDREIFDLIDTNCLSETYSISKRETEFIRS